MTDSNPIKNAVLVGVQLPQVSSEELQASLNELTRLVQTLGYHVVGQVTQKRNSEKSAGVLGQGKIKELAAWTGGSGKIAAVVEHKLSKAALKWQAEEREESSEETAVRDDIGEDTGADTETVAGFDADEDSSEYSSEDAANEGTKSPPATAQIVIVDTDLSPSQLRNLETATGVTVLDRTGVIIEIFSRHARTKSARLQVEIARLTYVAPRLRETGGGEDRQGGGIGGKGAGESSLELDKRRIRDRIKELKTELASIGNEHQIRRSKREQEICVALVGYTNAGKSSLMRALTGSDVLVADKLFATLDTTVRSLYPETMPKILVSDTVGFIKKLPHDLVASFKSTLDEALHASLLLYVVDASDPSFRSQLEVTQKVLLEVGVNNVPNLLILNKQDRLEATTLQELRLEFPEAVFLSTRSPGDVQSLREKILSYFEEKMTEAEIFIPYLAQGIVGEVRHSMKVLSESYNETGVSLKVRAGQEKIDQINKLLKAQEDLRERQRREN